MNDFVVITKPGTVPQIWDFVRDGETNLEALNRCIDDCVDEMRKMSELATRHADSADYWTERRDYYEREAQTAEVMRQTIERAEIYLETLISKAIYYHDWFERLGGTRYSRETVKPGDMVKLSTYSWLNVVKVVKCNPKTIYYDTGHGTLKAAYSDIEEIIETT
jgi:hypothetical protein